MASESMTIEKAPDGAYYSLFVNDVFLGNFDTVSEAVHEYEELTNYNK